MRKWHEIMENFRKYRFKAENVGENAVFEAKIIISIIRKWYGIMEKFRKYQITAEFTGQKCCIRSKIIKYVSRKWCGIIENFSKYRFSAGSVGQNNEISNPEILWKNGKVGKISGHWRIFLWKMVHSKHK